MAHNDRRKPCGACDREVAHTLDDRPYTHKCFKPEPDANGFEDPTPRGVTKFPAVSDPAPTVEPMDDTHCKQGGCKGCCGCSSECTDTPCGQPFKGPYRSTPCEIQECYCNDGDNPEKGSWFGAMYDGSCSVSECQIYEGDRIRADGQGGYECEDCGDSEPLAAVTMTRSQALVTLASEGPDADMASLAFEREQEEATRVLSAHPYAAVPEDPPVRNVVELRLPSGRLAIAVGDDFEDPTAPADVPDVLNVSGQPKARYQWRGSQNMGYLIKDPTTGDFRRYKNQNPMGWTRATTFNKAASDSKAINDWGKRNIVIGAARRRDVLLRAHGLTHESDRAALEGIVAELEEAAGAKVGSDLGTYLHSFTELMDAGLKTWRDAPEEFHRSLALYSQALADAGLEPVPGLIERTTCITEFGGVVGTFDRIFYHRPSGEYLIGDLKTGKTMEYAMDETNTQMWIYAHGVNQNGVYDWNTDTWTTADAPWGDNAVLRRIRVSEERGVIIHMPVQGEQEGTVSLVHADLQAGAKHAELCHAIRSRTKSKVRAFEPPAPPAPEPQLNSTEDDVWRGLFRAVRSGEEATALWRRAKEDGVQGVFLNELIGLAREAIRSHS